MNLRPYQAKAIADARSAMAGGAKGVCIVAPTGSGKTVMGAAIAAEHEGNVLWLAHRRELVEQAKARLPERVRVETVQSKPDLRGVTLLVLDECHHYAADSWFESARVPRRVGFTATPQRADGRGLDNIFDHMVVAATIRELVLQGQLAPLQVVRPDRCLDAGEIAQDPVAALREHAPNSRAVVFAPSVRAAIEYANAYRASGYNASVVHGDLPWHSRQEAVKCDVIVNVMCLTEGWDDPGVSVCVLARGCSSSGSLIQMVGRVLRPHPAKERALLIDLRGVTHVFGDPTEDMTYSLSGIGMRPKGAQVLFCACCAAPIGAYPCVACGHVPPEPELPRVVDAEIKFASKRSESVDERRATWKRWVIEAKAKGWKIGSVLYKYKAVYGHWPPKEVMR